MASLKITVRSSATEERTVEVPIPSSRPLGGNTEVREFLAMRARQRKAAARTRRIKRVSLALGAATAAAAFVVPRLRDGRLAALWTSGDAHALTAPAPGPDAFRTPAAVPGNPAPATASFDEPVSLATVAPAALASAVQAPSAAGTPPAAPDGAEAAAASAAPFAAVNAGSCPDDFAQHRWKSAVDSCTRAFESSPDPALALKVAHAHWARGDVALSGQWAQRAVALGTSDGDAYVLIGHADRRAGKTAEAVTAYRQYLRAAPRGWHARTVRAALRRLRPPVEQATAASEPTAQISVQ
jgi:hypothetical protein